MSVCVCAWGGGEHVHGERRYPPVWGVVQGRGGTNIGSKKLLTHNNSSYM